VLCTEADADQAPGNSTKVGTAFEKLKGATQSERFRTAENALDHIILDNDGKWGQGKYLYLFQKLLNSPIFKALKRCFWHRIIRLFQFPSGKEA